MKHLKALNSYISFIFILLIKFIFPEVLEILGVFNKWLASVTIEIDFQFGC